MIRQLVQENFYLVQILLGVGFISLAWIVMGSSKSPTGFKSRESDLAAKKPRKKSGRVDELAQARIRRSERLLLTGARTEGEPHEILGVPADAPLEEVERAFRELMKRYHPDRFKDPASAEWEAAQRIATALNQARSKMHERLGKR